LRAGLYVESENGQAENNSNLAGDGDAGCILMAGAGFLAELLIGIGGIVKGHQVRVLTTSKKFYGEA
jgi:hypothetical protein